MMRRRYAFIVADRATGAVRRFTVSVGLAIIVATFAVGVPLGWILHAGHGSQAENLRLRLTNARLELEISEYRTAASELVGSTSSLQTLIDNLAARTPFDALRLRETVEKLPASLSSALRPNVPGPVNGRTFDNLHRTLAALEEELHVVRRGVAFREAIVEATPILWPADGWVSAPYGNRRDPFTGLPDYHPAIDISTRSGEPVYATAKGLVATAHRSGDYGNLIEIDHGFGLITRYGHLSRFTVRAGDTVERGDVIGHVGSTGRATGSHVHYEVQVRGRHINPLRLISPVDTLAAN